MIDEVDEAVRTLIRQEALNGTQVEVVFDAPTKEWSSRRNSPTLDVYLYDIREDLRRRETGVIDVQNDVGRITGRRHPPRHFKLSYLVTAWTQRPEDEHRLLSAVLACFVRHDKLPADVLQGALADQALPVRVTVALPPPEDRALSDVWSAMGGELKPSLDLVITLPVDTQSFVPAATLVTEQPRFTVASSEGSTEQRQRRDTGSDASSESADARSEGKASGSRRGKSKAAVAAAEAAEAEAAAAEAAAARAAAEDAAAVARQGSAGGRDVRAGTVAAEETVMSGTAQHPGRIYHWRNIAETGPPA